MEISALRFIKRLYKEFTRAGGQKVTAEFPFRDPWLLLHMHNLSAFPLATGLEGHPGTVYATEQPDHC